MRKRAIAVVAICLLTVFTAGCSQAENNGSVVAEVEIRDGEFQLSVPQLVAALSEISGDEILFLEDIVTDTNTVLHIYVISNCVEFHITQNEETEYIKEVRILVDQKLLDNPDDTFRQYVACLAEVLAPGLLQKDMSDLTGSEYRQTQGSVGYYAGLTEWQHLSFTLLAL